MIYSRGYEITPETKNSVGYFVLGFLMLMIAMVTVAIGSTMQNQHVQDVCLGCAEFFGLVFAALFIAGIVLTCRESDKAKREWMEIVRVGGYLYSQNRLDPNLRRAEFVVRVEHADRDDYPVNHRWLDEGGNFNTGDLIYPRFK
jgi:hypothetical protein